MEAATLKVAFIDLLDQFIVGENGWNAPQPYVVEFV